MDKPAVAKIECEVTFLAETEHGPQRWPKMLSGNAYRPHLVVGDPGQRKAILRTKQIEVELADGTKRLAETDRFIGEEYLGVMFERGPDSPELGTPLHVRLSLMYWPAHGYEALTPGATFTVREGATIVGYGTVLRWLQPSPVEIQGA